MNKPLVTIIIPVYKTEQYLRRCLDSVCNQTYKCLEIICVDDQSPDSSIDILNEYAARDPRIVIVRNERNLGLAGARNEALKVATGEFLTNLDSDDYLDTTAVEKIMNVFTDDIDLVYFGFEILGLADEEERKKRQNFFNVKLEGKHKLTPGTLWKMSAAVTNKMFRRSYIEKYQIRFPEGKLYEDICFFGQVAGVVDNVYHLQELFYKYIQYEGSIMNNTYKTKDASRLFHYAEILYPMYDFYKKWGLLETRLPIFTHFFERCYNCVKTFAAPEDLPIVTNKLFEMAHKTGYRKQMTPFLLTDVTNRIHNIPTKTKRFLGIKVWSVKGGSNGIVYRLLGIKVLKKKYFPEPEVDSLFYSKKNGKLAIKFFGIKLFSYKTK